MLQLSLLSLSLWMVVVSTSYQGESEVKEGGLTGGG